MRLTISSITFLMMTMCPLNVAFTVPIRHDAKTIPTTQLKLMTAAETETLINTANDCAEGECSLDDVEELIAVLQQQQKELYNRVEEVKSMIVQLEKMNTHDERKVDEVRETVRAIFRLFQMGDKSSGNNYPSLSRPTGWSGEVGDGPKSAYDALPPKKWTATKS